MRLVEELRRLFASSDAPRLAQLNQELDSQRRERLAREWATAAFPFTVDALKRVAASGVESVELTASSLPRRLRRVPLGGLAQLSVLLEQQGLRVEPSRFGFFLFWE